MTAIIAGIGVQGIDPGLAASLHMVIVGNVLLPTAISSPSAYFIPDNRTLILPAQASGMS